MSRVLLLDKYLPTSPSGIVGQGPSVAGLERWLDQWTRRTPGKSPDKKAMLLVGPTGVGKSLTARLVAQHCGYEIKEFNASDRRSKKRIASDVKEYTCSKSVAALARPRRSGAVVKKVLIMDEVDAMGVGDRGGMTELISVIAGTQIPIICISNCYDQYASKVRSLATHCVCMVFRAMDTPAVSRWLAPIALAEGFSGDASVLQELAASSNGDLRHVLNTLQDYTGGAADAARKDTAATSTAKGLAKLFAGTAGSLDAQLSAYFADTGKAPLYVQEVYPFALGPSSSIDNMARVADAASEGDLIDATMRATQNYDLMSLHGIASCVRPAALSAGRIPADAWWKFPTWLGKNSTTVKNRRLITAATASMRAATGNASTDEVRLCYFSSVLRTILWEPLVKLQKTDGVDAVIRTMDAYGLDREGRQSVFDISLLKEPEAKRPVIPVPAALKAALTRTYDQRHLLVRNTTKKRRGTPRARASHGKRAKVGKPT